VLPFFQPRKFELELFRQVMRFKTGINDLIIAKRRAQLGAGKTAVFGDVILFSRPVGRVIRQQQQIQLPARNAASTWVCQAQQGPRRARGP